MKIMISPFPTLTDSMIKECGISTTEFVFSYISNQKENLLTLKPISIPTGQSIQNFNLVDDRGEWDATHFGSRITRTVRIEKPKDLFGVSGLGAGDSRIGIAVQVMSLSSNHRFSSPVITFDKTTEQVVGNFTYDLPANFYRDKISLRTVLYLHSSGNPKGEEENLAKIPGTIIGIIDEIAVFIDGTGSLFPIKKESDPSKPLWRVECDWSDPFSDLFTDENVCVILNQAHPSYSLLRIENGMNGSPFLTDVIASALQIIIEKTIDSIGGVDNLNDADSALPGSIIDAVRYFINTFGWDASGPERLAETIRIDFDRRTGNDS